MHDSPRRLAATIAVVFTVGLGSTSSQSPPITIDASEFALAAPARIDAGSARLQLRNIGMLDHHVRLLRLDSARSFRDFERALVDHGAVPPWASDVGGFESTTGGGASTTSIRLSAGVHVLICTARLTDGSSMAMKGMYRSIEVLIPSQHIPTRTN